MIKVALVENHNIVRSGVRVLLEKENAVTVVMEASNGHEFLEEIEKEGSIDVVVADMNMPVMDGIDLVCKLREAYPSVKVIILSMLDQESYVSQAMNEGAQGYLLKNVSRDELIFAIKHVAAGGKYICNEISLKILAKYTQSMQPPSQRTIDVNLSRRETEVLLLIAEGYTNTEIAGKLFTSRRTIEGHRKNLIDKTGARNTAALIRFAIQNGILK